MNVDEWFRLINFVSNKNQNGSITAENFNLLAKTAQSSYVSYLLGSFQTYQPGRPISKVELGQNSVVRQRLTPVIKRSTLTVDVQGLSNYPTDYLQADAMWTNTGYKKIRWSDQDRWDSMYNSVIDPVASNPIYMVKDVGFEFAPITIGTAKLSYVSVPPDIIWAFTLDVNNRRVYDPVNSVDPVWGDTSSLEIIVRMLALIGINLQVAALIQYSQDIKNSGQ
jgi:hypothetical protein